MARSTRSLSETRKLLAIARRSIGRPDPGAVAQRNVVEPRNAGAVRAAT